MSEFQGSDGQWELVEVGTTIKRLVPASEGESLLTIVYEGGVPFAAVFDKHDARLIASAPELLSVCEKIVDYRRRAGSVGFQLEKMDDFIHMAKAAIAKAIGRTALKTQNQKECRHIAVESRESFCLPTNCDTRRTTQHCRMRSFEAGITRKMTKKGE